MKMQASSEKASFGQVHQPPLPRLGYHLQALPIQKRRSFPSTMLKKQKKKKQKRIWGRQREFYLT